MSLSETGEVSIDTAASAAQNKDVTFTVSATSVANPEVKVTHTHTFHVYNPVFNGSRSVTDNTSSTLDNEVSVDDEEGFRIAKSWRYYWTVSFSNDGGLLNNSTDWNFSIVNTSTNDPNTWSERASQKDGFIFSNFSPYQYSKNKNSIVVAFNAIRLQGKIGLFGHGIIYLKVQITAKNTLHPNYSIVSNSSGACAIQHLWSSV